MSNVTHQAAPWSALTCRTNPPPQAMPLRAAAGQHQAEALWAEHGWDLTASQGAAVVGVVMLASALAWLAG